MHYFQFESRKISCAHLFCMDPTITSDDESGWQSKHPPEAVSKCLVPDHHRVVHLLLAIKAAKLSLVIVDGNAENLETFRSVFLLHHDELRNFSGARPAPGSPETYQHNASFVITHPQSMPVQVGERERRGICWQSQARISSVRTEKDKGGRKQCKYGDCKRDFAHQWVLFTFGCGIAFVGPIGAEACWQLKHPHVGEAHFLELAESRVGVGAVVPRSEE